MNVFIALKLTHFLFLVGFIYESTGELVNYRPTQINPFTRKHHMIDWILIQTVFCVQKSKEYSMEIMRQTACLVVYPIMSVDYILLFQLIARRLVRIQPLPKSIYIDMCIKMGKPPGWFFLGGSLDIFSIFVWFCGVRP